MISQCQSKIRKLSVQSNVAGQQGFNNNRAAVQTDRRLMKNVVSNLAQQLQELTTSFRKNQNVYLKSKTSELYLNN